MTMMKGWEGHSQEKNNVDGPPELCHSAAPEEVMTLGKKEGPQATELEVPGTASQRSGWSVLNGTH